MTVSPISPAPPGPSGSSSSDGSRSGPGSEFDSLMGVNLGKQSAGHSHADDAPGATGSMSATQAGSDSGSASVATSPKVGEAVAKELKDEHDGADKAPGAQAASVLSVLSGMLSGAQGVAVKTGAAHVDAAVTKGGKNALKLPGQKDGGGKVAATTGPTTSAKAGCTPAAGALRAAAASEAVPGPADRSKGPKGSNAAKDPEVAAGQVDAAALEDASTGTPKIPATSQALSAPRSEQGLAHSAPTRTDRPSADEKPSGHGASRTPGTQTVGVQSAAPATTAHEQKSSGHTDTTTTLPLTDNTPGSLAGTTGAVPTAQTSTVSGPTAHAATIPGASIPDQVFGEVTRLISRGDGTHRITLNLHPADLGDVRVTLTLKHGSVSVSLAAGHDARQALASGTHELHRLLQAAGAHTADIVVKDLPVQSTSRFDLDPGAANGGRAGGHNPEQTARTWSGDTSARDGDPTTATRAPSANPGTRTRSSGVDVSM